MSFRICALLNYRDLLTRYPEGAGLLERATSTNDYFEPDGEGERACAEFIVICAELEKDAKGFQSDDWDQARRTRHAAALRLALLTVARLGNEPKAVRPS